MKKYCHWTVIAREEFTIALSFSLFFGKFENL